MRHDKHAAAAFGGLHKKGMSKREAKRQIEECFAAIACWQGAYENIATRRREVCL
jgi:hypothetical protein